jgi:hypothetical protein
LEHDDHHAMSALEKKEAGEKLSRKQEKDAEIEADDRRLLEEQEAKHAKKHAHH